MKGLNNSRQSQNYFNHLEEDDETYMYCCMAI